MTRPTARSSPSSWSRCSRSRPTRAPNTAEAGEQLRALRRKVRETARGHGPDDRLGRHPSVRAVGGPADRRRARATATSSPRCASSRARSSSSGMHVHVGVDDPDKAIHVANGMRVHLPVLLALSANSPFWRADATGPACRRARRSSARSRASASRPPTATGTTTARRSSSWSPAASWRTTRTSGTTCARTRSSAPSRSACCDCADARGAHARRWPRSSRRWSRSWPSTTTSGEQLRRLPVADARREQVARGPPRPRRRARRPARRTSGCATKTLARRLLDRLRGHAEDLGSAARPRRHRAT